MFRNRSFQAWLDKGKLHCTFRFAIINNFSCTKITLYLGLVYCIPPFNIFSKPISTKTIADASLVKPKNVPKWGKHLLTYLCAWFDFYVSCKFISFNVGTQSHHLFYSGIYFRKSERILWLKQCNGIIVTGRLPFHMALIKDWYTIC